MDVPTTDGGLISLVGSARRNDRFAVPNPRDLLRLEYLADDTWYYVGAPGASQGWKLYVSATVENYASDLPTILGTLASLSVPFKYIKSIEALASLNSGLFGYSQIGKCVVAYVEHLGIVDQLVNALRMATDMQNHVGPFVPRLSPVWSGGSVYYRFGSYTSRSLVCPEGVVDDDRENPVAVDRLGIDDPFVVYGGERPGAAKDHSLARYPIVGEFCRSGKGGVFVALDLSRARPTEVVVKVGLRNGQVMGDGRDAYAMIKRESEMYDLFVASGLDHLIPQRIDVVSDDTACCLVTEFFDVPNMDEMREAGNLAVEMIVGAIEAIKSVNSAGIVLVDAKLSNALHDGARCRLVDLESAFCRESAGSLATPGPSSFHFDGLVPSDARFDETHFLVSCLYDSTAFRPGDKSIGRRLNLRKFLDGHRPRDAIAEYALTMLKRLV